MFTWIKSMSRVTNRLLQSIYNPPLCTSVCKPFTTIIWPISSNIVRVNDFSLLFLLFKYIFAQFSRYIKVLGFAALHGNHSYRTRPRPARWVNPGPGWPGALVGFVLLKTRACNWPGENRSTRRVNPELGWLGETR
jgi:hypothetical protein